MKNILMLMWANKNSTRNFLESFARYARTRRDWIVYLRSPEDLRSDEMTQKIKSGFFAGIVAEEGTFDAHPIIASSPSTALLLYATYDPNFKKVGGNVTFAQYNNNVLGRFVADYLLKLGNFNSFAYVPFFPYATWSATRGKSFAARLTECGHHCHIFDGTTSLKEFLKSLRTPAALMAACDRVALDVLEACREVKIAVPGKIAVIGVDNDEIVCEFARPSLTSIGRGSVPGLGMKAAKALASMLRGVRSEKPRLVEENAPIVVERESCQYLTPAMHIARTAMEFIRKNPCRNLHVGDVVGHLGVSRRLAELRFSEIYDKSILEAITECRLTEVARRLSASRLSIGKIAAHCSFDDTAYLGRIFRRRYGMSMSEWRKSRP